MSRHLHCPRLWLQGSNQAFNIAPIKNFCLNPNLTQSILATRPLYSLINQILIKLITRLIYRSMPCSYIHSSRTPCRRCNTPCPPEPPLSTPGEAPSQPSTCCHKSSSPQNTFYPGCQCIPRTPAHPHTHWSCDTLILQKNKSNVLMGFRICSEPDTVWGTNSRHPRIKSWQKSMISFRTSNFKWLSAGDYSYIIFYVLCTVDFWSMKGSLQECCVHTLINLTLGWVFRAISENFLLAFMSK